MKTNIKAIHNSLEELTKAKEFILADTLANEMDLTLLDLEQMSSKTIRESRVKYRHYSYKKWLINYLEKRPESINKKRNLKQ